MGYPPLRWAGAEDSRGPPPVHAALPETYVISGKGLPSFSEENGLKDYRMKTKTHP
jgi:hypothetical protein